MCEASGSPTSIFAERHRLMERIPGLLAERYGAPSSRYIGSAKSRLQAVRSAAPVNLNPIGLQLGGSRHEITSAPPHHRIERHGGHHLVPQSPRAGDTGADTTSNDR